MKLSPLFKSAALAAAITAVTVGDVFAQRRAPRKAVSRYAEMALDFRTGETLHAQNADTKLHPASLTKMMTAYVVFEAIAAGDITLDQNFRVSHAAYSFPSSVRLPLRAGSTARVSDLLTATLCFSANNAAIVLAEGVAGSVSKFANRMNNAAQRLGMKNSVFYNPNGWEHRLQRSSARDMAILMAAVIRDYPEHYDRFFSVNKFTYARRTYTSTVDLLDGYVDKNGKRTGGYPGVDGGKTGFFRNAGFNLVVSARKDDTRVVTVIFGSVSGRARKIAMTRLLDTAFARAARLHPPRPRTIDLLPLPVFQPSIILHPDSIAAQLRYDRPLPRVQLPIPPIKTDKQRRAEARAEKKQRKIDERNRRAAERQKRAAERRHGTVFHSSQR